jgi:hypothetical protein
MERDVVFLKEHGINDYSLLLGVHHLKDYNELQEITEKIRYTPE